MRLKALYQVESDRKHSLLEKEEKVLNCNKEQKGLTNEKLLSKQWPIQRKIIS